MKTLIQRLKIGIVSIGFLITFGILLHILAHYITYRANTFGIVFVFVCMLLEGLIAAKWLDRLNRELIVLKYRKKKNDRIRKKDDGGVTGKE